VQTLFLVAAIVSPALSVVIRCEFYDWEYIIVGTRYTCNVIELVIGTHVTIHSNRNVEGFYSSGNAVENPFQTFPEDLENYFPSLVLISIPDHRLTEITSNDLAPWPKLAVLNLKGNQIKTLNANLFRNSPKLRWISFDRNSISNVGAGLLSNLNELKQADFDNNPCINFSANNPQALIELKCKLLTQCPRFETTTTTTPAPRSIYEEVDRLRTLVEEHANKIDKLNAITSEQKVAAEDQARTAAKQAQTMNEQTRRIESLERNVRRLAGTQVLAQTVAQ